MTTTQEKLDWRGHKMVDSAGDKIGKIDEIYVDDASGEPEWALVNTGLFGTSSNLVPLADARADGDDVVVAHTKDTVKDAPQLGEGQQLSREDEAELYRYYGIDDVRTHDQGHEAGTDTPPPAPDVDGDMDGDHDGGDSMVRSEEELHVGTATRESGGLRLRKHVVTEEETATVAVSHEEAHVTREKISDDDAGSAGNGELSEETQEVVLTEEVPTVETEVVAKERIGVDVDAVQEEQQVSADVRKEEVEVVEDDADRG